MSNQETNTTEIEKAFKEYAKENSIYNRWGADDNDYPAHEMGFKAGFIAGARSRDEEIEHRDDIIFELEENLKCAEDQNHYFDLMCKYRDEVEQLREDLKAGTCVMRRRPLR